MSADLTPEAVAQMVADREIGTKGPWTFEIDEDTQEPRLYGDGSLIAVFGNHMTMSEAAWIPEADARRSTRLPDLEAAYLTLAAENATLRASEAAALERVKVLEAELAAAEANINIKADWIDATINDMERVEKALETAKTRHIGDQPSYSSASDLGWAHQEYASLRRDIIAALTPTADRTEYERKVAQMKEDFPNGI